MYRLILRSIFFKLFAIMSASTALAGEQINRPLISYFTDNIVFEIVYNGGWYSVGIISVLLLISMISQGFREMFFSIVLAIFGLFLMIFVYEAVQDFKWIPEIVA